jgi:hypothetical protein
MTEKATFLCAIDVKTKEIMGVCISNLTLPKVGGFSKTIFKKTCI